MDHCVHGAIVAGLRARGIDVLTAREDNYHEVDDSLVLDRATELERIMFTQDIDFPIEAERRQRLGIPFHGVIYARKDRVPIGRCIEDLQLLAEAEDLENLVDRVTRLPI